MNLYHSEFLPNISPYSKKVNTRYKLMQKRSCSIGIKTTSQFSKSSYSFNQNSKYNDVKDKENKEKENTNNIIYNNNYNYKNSIIQNLYANKAHNSKTNSLSKSSNFTSSQLQNITGNLHRYQLIQSLAQNTNNMLNIINNRNNNSNNVNTKSTNASNTIQSSINYKKQNPLSSSLSISHKKPSKTPNKSRTKSQNFLNKTELLIKEIKEEPIGGLIITKEQLPSQNNNNNNNNNSSPYNQLNNPPYKPYNNPPSTHKKLISFTNPSYNQNSYHLKKTKLSLTSYCEIKECPICKKNIPSYRFSFHKSIHPSLILPNIYLGSYNNASNFEELKLLNINYVLNCAIECLDYFPKGVTYCHYKLCDTPTFPIRNYFDRAADFIESVINKGGVLLIHCQLGISRSTTCLIAYFIKKLGYNTMAALNFIKKKRSIVMPNYGFLEQLIKYERRVKKEREDKSGNDMK